MSVETYSTDGKKVKWIGMPGLDQVEIGALEIAKREFFKGISLFLAGEKEIAMGDVNMRIPETIDEPVKIGGIEMPYPQFVRGIMWGMSNQRGTLGAEPHARSLDYATLGVIDLAEKALLGALPERKQERIDILNKAFRTT